MLTSRVADAIVDDAYGDDTVPELQQIKNPNAFVMPVAVQGAVTTRALPAQDGSIGTRVLDAVTPVVIYGRDERRVQLTLIPIGGPVWVGYDSGSVLGKQGNAGLVPAGTPFYVRNPQEVWVMADAGAATSVTYSAEFWAV